MQKDQFGMYALYSKNKPKSDSLLASHGNTFFKVNSTACLTIALGVGSTQPALVLWPHAPLQSEQSTLIRRAVGASACQGTLGAPREAAAFTPCCLSQFKQVQLGDKMDLASYLLKPIQRMSKYALLLKDLIKECSEAQEQELGYLRAAEEMVKFQLRHGNDLLAMDAIRDCDVRSSALLCAALWGQSHTSSFSRLGSLDRMVTVPSNSHSQ